MTMVEWLDNLIRYTFCGAFAPDSFFAQPEFVFALLALLFVGLSCGAVGSVVVATRMAFFSDALAHCAFAGIGIGFLFFELVLEPRGVPKEQFWTWVTPLMIGFGICIGFGIAAVRQATGLASDTIIGVFFAGAIGLAAALRKIIHSRQFFSLEDILFGDPLFTNAGDLISLALLTILTFAVLAWIGNGLYLASFNTSLALSRRVNIQVHQYVFMILLAILVNLCLRTVGALLINTLLIVPAATAANLSRNLRQMFWLTITLCVGCCLGGQWLNWELLAYGIKLDIAGTVVLLTVGFFFLSVLFGPILRNRKPA
jgi:zinc transport system permease protein